MLNSQEAYDKIYFVAHYPGAVDLVIDPDIRRSEGPITLSVAAAEDLLTNLRINSELARAMAEDTERGRALTRKVKELQEEGTL